MGKRRVNDEGKKNWNKAFHLPFDKTTKIMGDTPSFFRYRNVVKGQFVGNQLIAGWLMTDGSKVISTDSLLIAQRGEDIRGDKYLESKVKIDILVTQINPELEPGIYDPIFGLPFPGTSEDARSVGFVDVVAGADYKFNLVGVELEASDYNYIGTFGSVLSTTEGDVPDFNFGNITDKGTFGSSSSTTGGDLPSSGNSTGDHYTCDENDFISAEASNIFDKGDTVTYAGGLWRKNETIVQADDGYVCDTNNYESNNADITYDIGQIAILNSSGVWIIQLNEALINVLQYDADEEISGALDQVAYDQTLTLDTDTVKVKVWATNILVDNGEIIDTYRISQLEKEYKGISEMMDYTVTEEPSQELGAIRKRRNRDITVIKLS
jgi:hypothetical protein